MNNPIKTYRLGVGIMLINKAGKIFVGKRIDTPNAWQMPQGGVEENEDLTNAVFREMEEEIGTKNARIIAVSKEWHYYDLPENLVSRFWNGQYSGQKQMWYLCEFLGNDNEINLNFHTQEFCEWKWIDIELLTSIIVPFKRELYKKIVNEFNIILENHKYIS